MQVAFYLSGNKVHDRVILAMHEGCHEHRRVILGFKPYIPADVAVVFGVRKSRVPVSWPRGEVIELHKSLGKPVVILETGYIYRGDGEHHYYAAGLNGLNGRADFRNAGMPSDRAEKLNIKLGDRREGSKIILCGQVPQDASVDHIDIMEWLVYARDEIKKRTDREIVYRPHPLASTKPIEGCSYSTKTLADDLADAHCVVTFNSNSAVEAAIAGVPVFAFDQGSMALPIANTDFDAIESPSLPDRTQWLDDLAYAQWGLDEMRGGEAWAHLFR